VLTRRSFLVRAAAALAAVPVLASALREAAAKELPEEIPDAGNEYLVEIESPPAWTRMSGGFDEYVTTITIDDAAIFQAGDGAFVPRTNELLRVVQVVGSRGIVVERGVATTPSKMLDLDWVLRLPLAG